MKLGLINHFYYLLLSSYLVFTEKQIYLADVCSFKSLINEFSQDVFECLSQFGLSIYSLYILFNYYRDINMVLYLVLIVYIIFYFMDGISNALLLTDLNNVKYRELDEYLFVVNRIIQKFVVLILFYLIYTLILS